MQGLTELQLTVLEIVSRHRSDNPVTNLEISRIVDLRPRDTGKEGADMRSVINALRCKGYPICGSDRGYFWASNDHELSKYIGQLEGRIAKIQGAADGLKMAYQNIEAEFPSDYVPTINANRTVRAYKVRSKSEPEKSHQVAVMDSGEFCDCPAFQYRGVCRHVRKVRVDIARKEPEQSAMFGRQIGAI